MSSAQTPGSVLVKCKPALGVSKRDLIIITIPVDDQLITIKELKDKITKKTSGLLRLSEKQPLQLSDFTLSWSQTKCALGRELDYFLPFHQPVVFHADIMCSMPREERVFTVIVKPLTGKRISIHLTASCLVEEVKCKLEERTGVPMDQQMLLFGAKQLVDSCPVKLYNIGEGSELHLISRLRGGLSQTVRFADISESSHMQTLRWDPYGPKWLTAGPGLCVEGHCTNLGCAANGKTVICNRGMGTFDLVVDAHKIDCPVCHLYIVPETCGFNNCEWRYSGTIARNASFSVVRSLDWTLVGNQYDRFSNKAACMVDWSRLLILTRDPQQSGNAGECAICLANISDARSDPDMVTKCGHRYHISCIEAWKKMGKKSCPKCLSSL